MRIFIEFKEFYCYNSNKMGIHNTYLQKKDTISEITEINQTGKSARGNESAANSSNQITDMGQIGELVRFHRKKSQLTQKQLADLSGVGKTVVYDIEKGKQSVQLKTLIQILNTLNMNISIQSPLMDAYSGRKE